MSVRVQEREREKVYVERIEIQKRESDEKPWPIGG